MGRRANYGLPSISQQQNAIAAKNGKPRMDATDSKACEPCRDPAKAGGKGEKSGMARLLWIAAFFAVFALGARLRLDELASRGLEYDEIWTYLNYVLKGGVLHIFTDLATPNNHPLSSLLCLGSTGLLGNCPLTLRLPAFICGLILPPLIGLLAWTLLKSRGAALAAMAACAFNGGLIHYSQTARGYSAQSLFVALSIGALLLHGTLGESGRRWAAVLFFASSALSALTVPTGAVFAAAAGAMWLILNADFKNFKPFASSNRWMLLSFAICGVFFAVWYGVNLPKFREGQRFGDSIANLWQLLDFIWARLSELFPWLWAAPLLALLGKETRKTGAFCAGFIALSLLSALVVKGGGARVYLPLAPAIALGAAAAFVAIGKLFKREWIGTALSLAAAGAMALAAQKDLKRWTPLDWKKEIPPLAASVPAEVYLCYPAGDCYPISYNCYPSIQRDEAARRELFGNALATVESPGSISGLDMSTNRRDIKIPADIPPSESHRGAGLSVEVYRLRKLEPYESCAGKIALLKLDLRKDGRIAQGCLGGEWMLLNAFLNKNGEKETSAFRMLAAESPALSPMEMAMLAAKGAEFFTLASEGR